MAKNDIESRLLALQNKIEDAKELRARAEGALAECKKQLKVDFKVNDLKEAKALLAKLEAEAAQLEKDLEKGLSELEAKVLA